MTPRPLFWVLTVRLTVIAERCYAEGCCATNNGAMTLGQSTFGIMKLDLTTLNILIVGIMRLFLYLHLAS
jgi:hypothetical protein